MTAGSWSWAGLGLYVVGVGPGLVWPPGQVVPAVGLVIAVVGLVVTVQAQGAMGSSWRIGVDAAEQTPLVVDGPFRRARNPISPVRPRCPEGCR